MDLLSDIIGVMRTGRPSANRLRVGSPWCYRFVPYDGAGFHVVVRGSGWLLMDRRKPIQLGTGDVVLLPAGHAHVLSDSRDGTHPVPFETAVADPAGSVEMLCGKYRLDRRRTHPLLRTLPELVHLPTQAGDHRHLRAAVDLLAAETTTRRPGRDAALAGLLDLLLIYMVRAWFDDHGDGGWPRALRDPAITSVLEAMHSDPGRPWRVEDLAAAAGLSRTTLARRFTGLVGQAPMTYLTQWRMTLATRLLSDTDLGLAAVARQLGYASPFAFSHAFKREFGVAPGHYRDDRRTADVTPNEERAD
ncbi:AraC family transcriptional regulator [Actinomadura darangshiensis]|uniref:AraC family transcriptional regulator n=1 Tax=Actinomadura darangshiensis TaxID=705336 RepID=A0A4R5AB12_9ACTN|nr:AraC family transcriptional regulator [Actinomadura darangshiensis]TDD66942.1 AraC family transcriptional regulator [Actinomadura darangshiensis]